MTKQTLEEKINKLSMYQSATNSCKRGGLSGNTIDRFQANWKGQLIALIEQEKREWAEYVIGRDETRSNCPCAYDHRNQLRHEMRERAGLN